MSIKSTRMIATVIETYNKSYSVTFFVDIQFL